MNMLSRHFEYQADAYAVNLGFSLAGSTTITPYLTHSLTHPHSQYVGPLTKIHVENSGNMVPGMYIFCLSTLNDAFQH